MANNDTMCVRCDGRGVIPTGSIRDSAITKCLRCNGTGSIRLLTDAMLSQMTDNIIEEMILSNTEPHEFKKAALEEFKRRRPVPLSLYPPGH